MPKQNCGQIAELLIDFADDARQKTLDDIIQSARQRIEFEEKANHAYVMNRSRKERISSFQSRVREYEAMAPQQYGPFQLPEGKVMIRPIQWTK